MSINHHMSYPFRPAQQTKVFLGRMDMSNPIKASEEMRTVVDVSCDTPPHSSPIRRDGVCVLTLSMPVNFTDTLYPICLPSGDSNFITGMESYVATGKIMD
ncbi:serine protease 27-like [Xyrichtys novacula]|uniref:Serine protease 27-like n=1 Tax=Xyrichtys novacula TaxID=13765 RepID=A0AAV1HMA7_XYRNO|nr:serine protease 27-like [Xyrichtys novacula]